MNPELYLQMLIDGYDANSEIPIQLVELKTLLIFMQTWKAEK